MESVWIDQTEPAGLSVKIGRMADRPVAGTGSISAPRMIDDEISNKKKLFNGEKNFLYSTKIVQQVLFLLLNCPNIF